MLSFLRVFTVLCAIAGAGILHAQTWPNGLVKIVVPFPPGGTSDQLARLVAKELQDQLGQPVVVENRGGAGGSIAADAVIHSTPDGSTIMFGSNSVFASNVSLYKKMSYNPLTDFAPLMFIGDTPVVLLVRADSPIKTLAEFVKYAKENPGKLSGGYGSSSVQSAIAQLSLNADIKVLAVPYKSVPLSVADLLGGTIDFVMTDINPAIPQVNAGKLRPLGLAQSERVSLVPDWPAIGATYPRFENSAGWFAMAAPAKTPPAVVNKIYASLKAVTDKKEFQSKLMAMGVTMKPLPPAETGKFFAAEVERWRVMFQAAGVVRE